SMYKDRRGITFLLALCSFLFVSAVSPSPSFATTPTLNIPLKLTTHIADDFQPAVSPDGKLAAFVSNRSGNNDIWLVPINGGPARQMTFHTASDSAPAWSRDGKRLAFASLREDSKGDIWALDLDGNIESRITGSSGPESNPSWFPDGRRIAFSRGEEVWSIDLPTHKEERLFNGLYPSVSPDGRFIAFISFDGLPSGARGELSIYDTADNKITRLTSGELSDAFPSWSPDGREIYFSRFSEDTNNDGLIDIKDNPSIWRISFSDDFQFIPHPSSFIPDFQLTSGSSYDLFPSATDNSVIYAAGKGKDIDIYRVQRDGEVPSLKTAREQLELAYRQRDALHRLLAFRKVYLSGFPRDEGLFSEARYQAALAYMEMGHRKDAIRELESINSKQTLVRHPSSRIPHPSSLILNEYASLARIELAKINAADAVSAGDKDRALEEVKTLNGIIDEYKDHPYSQAMAQLETGNIYLSLKDDVQALKEYEKVRGLYSSEAPAVAQSRLKIADIFSSYGDELRMIDTYLSIIKDYPESLEWCLTASQRVLSLIERIEDERERLARYREIISKYKGLPYLPALAQYKVGEFYHVRGRHEEAVSVYRRVIDDFPSETSVADEASIAMAEVWLSKGSHGNALSIYEGLMKKGVLRAGRLFINTSLEKGRMELLGKEPAQAIKSYKSVIDLDYNDVRAHRGLIAAYAAKGEPQKAVAIYTEEVKKFGDSDTAHYALGLAYTYMAGTVPDLRTERRGVVEPGLSPLNAAESEIKTALSQNYSLPFAHQTLGWIYEIKDKTENSRTMGLAVDEYMAALALFPPEQKKEASDLLLNIGNGYSALGNHEKGYEYYKKRLETGVAFDDRMREAVFYENLGNAASRTGKYTEAVPYYLKCLVYAKKVRDRKWELKITEEMALLYQEAKDFAKAAEYFSQALKIAEEADMAESRAVILRNIAYNLYHAGKIEEGIGYFNKSLDALNVKEDISSTSGGLLTIKKALSLNKEGSESFMGFEKAGEEKLIHSYLGSAYAEIGEYESALNELLKKLEQIPEGRDTERGIVLNNIGFLYYQMGDAGNANRYFNDSLKVSGKSKNFTGEMVNIINIGLLATQSECGMQNAECGIEEARKLQERGVSLIESGVKRSRRMGTVPVLNRDQKVGWAAPTDLDLTIKTSLDSISQDREHLKKAAAEFSEGLIALGKKKDLWLEAVLELNLATSLYQLGNDKDASVHLNSVMEIVDKGSLNDLKWRYLSLLAEIDIKNKEKQLEDAVAVLEVGAGLAPAQGQPQGLPLQTETLYKELIYLLFSKGQIDDAFTYAERMAWNRTKQEAAKARFPLPKEEAPLSARDVQWLLDEKTALVRYLFTDRGLLIWFIDADTVRGKVINISEKYLREGVDDLLSTLDKKEINDRLSSKVISPIAPLLANKKRVYIMPDAILSPVPFAALKIENKKGTVPD
ncbi:MAG: PD40 domain-containing protein, partial [Deltaproteobacteria bacterium]|nr:PD40 domain-containing protein [Deltaproteobacteria bacterium]